MSRGSLPTTEKTGLGYMVMTLFSLHHISSVDKKRQRTSLLRNIFGWS